MSLGETSELGGEKNQITEDGKLISNATHQPLTITTDPCISQGLRPMPPAPQHDVVVSACHVLACWLQWMLEFVLVRWFLHVSIQSIL